VSHIGWPKSSKSEAVPRSSAENGNKVGVSVGTGTVFVIFLRNLVLFSIVITIYSKNASTKFKS
jgi:hypothetical protein